MTVVLVTGATGFVGRYIIAELISREIKVKCNVRRYSTMLPGQVNQVLIPDLFNSTDEELDQLFDEVNIVIHCAWYVNHDDYMVSLENLTALAGSLKLANYALRKNITKFVGIGTCAEYDWAKSVKHQRTETPNPSSPYGAAKAAMFLSLEASFNNTNMGFLWCRIFNVFGNGEKPNRLVPLIKQKIKHDEELFIQNGDKILDFLHIKAAARNIVQLALGSYTGPHNICSGRGQSIKEFAISYARAKHKQHLLKFSNTPIGAKKQISIVGQPTLDVSLDETRLGIYDG